MHDLTVPSRLPGWALVTGVVVAGLLGVHVALAAFAHNAMAQPDGWLRHIASPDGWRAFSILVRCIPSEMSALVSGGTVRLPTLYQRWCREWWHALDSWLQDAGGSFLAAILVFMTLVGVGAYSSARARLVPRGPWRRRTTAYATRDELQPFLRPRGTSSEQMLRAGALPLGRTVHDDGRGLGPDLWLPLRHRGQHIWTLGVTGVGKTSGIIKRWLAADALLDGHHAPVMMSTVAVDVKDPDLWEFAAPVAQRYDRRVIHWSPMSAESMGHNFLDYVHTVGDTLEMAETILTNDPEYNRKDPFWRQTELNMLAMTIQFVCEEPAERLANALLQEKMANVLGVAPPPRSLAFILGLSHLHPSEFMAYIEHVDGQRTVWRDRYSKVFQARDERTIGTWQGLQNVLVIFRDPDVIAATSRSDFHLSVLARQPTTLVIGLPRKPSSRRQILTALFLRQLLQALDDIVRATGSQRLPVPVTFLLDELAVLGLIPTFHDFVATYRDIGVAFVLATQDRAQLVDVYGQQKTDTILANLHTRIIFGRDLRPEQAEEICRALGEKIVPEPGVSYEHKSPLAVVRRGTRMTYQVRRLLEPNELRTFPEFRAVVVLPGDVKVLVDLPPVHSDPEYNVRTRRVSAVETLRHDMRMDHVLGRLPPLPRITGTALPLSQTGAPPPKRVQPAAISKGASTPAEQGDVAPRSSALAPESRGVDQRPERPVPTAAVDPTPGSSKAGVRPLAAPAGVSTTGTLPIVTRGAHEKAGMTYPPSGRVSGSGAVAHHPSDAGSSLTAFVTEVLFGSLRDERLAPGSPRGWVLSDHSGTFLVPWGFLRHWAIKTSRRFIELETMWVRVGLAHGRASIAVQGRAITCLLFSRRAALQLPKQHQRALTQSFASIATTDLRLSTAYPTRGWKANPVGGRQPVEQADDSPPPPRLIDFLKALDQQGTHFIGHRARTQEPAVHGRWRATSKGGGNVLLVERNAARAIFESLGVADPVDVLTGWRQAGILYLAGQVRGGFYTRRTYAEGNEFLTLRWDQISRYLPRDRIPGPTVRTTQK